MVDEIITQDYFKVYRKEYYQRNRDKEIQYSKKYYDKNKEIKIQYSKTYQQINKEKQNGYAKNYYISRHPKYRERIICDTPSKQRRRTGLLQILGNKCIRCGFMDSRALQFDHINDDGYLDKQNMKHANSIILYYYKNPEIAKQKLQILCANCNWIKRYECKKHNHYNR